MARVDLVMPKMGESIIEATILKMDKELPNIDEPCWAATDKGRFKFLLLCMGVVLKFFSLNQLW